MVRVAFEDWIPAFDGMAVSRPAETRRPKTVSRLGPVIPAKAGIHAALS
jgi:hypothetical protein